MAKKEKKVSVTVFEKTVNDNYSENTTTIDWNGVEVDIKPTLSLQEMLLFVNEVADSCFIESESGTEMYMPELFDFALKCAVVEIYSNITLPSNTEKRYELLYKCKVYEDILDRVDIGQFERMVHAIHKKIDYKIKVTASGVEARINSFINELNNIGNGINEIFSGVSKEDVSALMNSMTNMGIDEDKLIKAIYKTKLGD